jgi:hypothetical protein
MTDTLNSLQKGIADAVERADPDPETHYRAQWRFYHGWHRGKTKMIDRTDLEEALSLENKWWRTFGRVSFAPDYGFSDVLLCVNARGPLYDTVRDRQDGAGLEQKMVDTALVCDLLQFARGRQGETALVLSNDDDVLPGVFVAEAWKCSVFLLHTRDTLNRFMDVDRLAYRMTASYGAL